MSASLSEAHRLLETHKWQREEIQRSITDRIATIEIAERILTKRERNAQIKEAVMCQALTAVRQGPQRDLEEHIGKLITAHMSRLPPPVMISGHVRELEDRAVQLECALVHVRHRLVDISRREESLRLRSAEVQMKESEVKSVKQNLNELWRELELRENALLTAKSELVNQEAHLFQWAEDLKTRELLLDERERCIMLVADTTTTTNARASTTTRNMISDNDCFKLSFHEAEGNAKPTEEMIEEQRRLLVDVADYLERRCAAVESLRTWVEDRAAVIDEVLLRLEAVHVLPPTPAPRADDVSPLRDDIHPLLQLVKGRSS